MGRRSSVGNIDRARRWSAGGRSGRGAAVVVIAAVLVVMRLGVCGDAGTSTSAAICQQEGGGVVVQPLPASEGTGGSSFTATASMADDGRVSLGAVVLSCLAHIACHGSASTDGIFGRIRPERGNASFRSLASIKSKSVRHRPSATRVTLKCDLVI